jgi:hypothetical protein
MVWFLRPRHAICVLALLRGAAFTMGEVFVSVLEELGQGLGGFEMLSYTRLNFRKARWALLTLNLAAVRVATFEVAFLNVFHG